MERTKPPFRAEHVGSLIRPSALIDAREKAEKKEISDAELKRVQHAAIVTWCDCRRSSGSSSSPTANTIATPGTGISC